MQHAANETAIAEDCGCIPNGPVQGRNETGLLKEYDTLSGKPGRKKGNQSGCDTKQVSRRNIHEAEKRKSANCATKQQPDYASS